MNALLSIFSLLHQVANKLSNALLRFIFRQLLSTLTAPKAATVKAHRWNPAEPRARRTQPRTINGEWRRLSEPNSW